MPELIIKGIPIQFPFDPYPVQHDYMSKVIECLQTNSNGALESPTGTGKTLCLLCATLGWLEFQKAKMQADYVAIASASNAGLPQDGFGGNMAMADPNGAPQAWTGFGITPKIIYASRTHSQLSQAIAELKRTKYKYMKVAVLGSRDQLCIHPEVSKEVNNNTKLHMCQIRVKSKTCYFHNQVEGKKDDPAFRSGVLDIEDLVKYGRRRTCCPYYLSRDLKTQADIVFMPYNYLLDPKTRLSQGIELQGHVVILDEAHNVEKMCEESASLQLRSAEIALCIDEVTQVMQKLKDTGTEHEVFAANDPDAGQQDFELQDLCILKTLLLTFEQEFDRIAFTEEGQSLPGSFMFDLLQKCEITPSKKTVICDLLDKLVQYLTNNSSSPFQRKGAGLQKFSDLIKIVFSKDNFSVAHMELIKRSYKVHMAEDDTIKKSRKARKEEQALAAGWGSKASKGAEQSNTLMLKKSRLLSYWCFNPGFGMKELVDQGLRCLIVTSGTLSPLQSFVEELQVGFPVQLENPHIIKSNQVMVGVINKGPNGEKLNSSFNNRSKYEYVHSLGQTLLNLTRMVPGGLLVFFPSYPVMAACHELWVVHGIWDKIVAIKTAFLEPQGKDGFTDAMHQFYEKVNDPSLRGAIFMAVCRGKVSEGLDFADGNGRAVLITGLPYPPFKDARVMLKRQYLDTVSATEKRGLTGAAWYKLEASRAVNQAIGRVIRHKNDYGAILLADERFGERGFVKQLSKWVQPHLKIYYSFGPVIRDLSHFFKSAQALLPQPTGNCSKYLKKDCDFNSSSSIPSACEPPPVSSNALGQGPSRIVPRAFEPRFPTLSAHDNELPAVDKRVLRAVEAVGRQFGAISAPVSAQTACNSALDSLHLEEMTNEPTGHKSNDACSFSTFDRNLPIDFNTNQRKRNFDETAAVTPAFLSSPNPGSTLSSKFHVSSLCSATNSKRKKIKVVSNSNKSDDCSEVQASSAREEKCATNKKKFAVEYMKQLKANLSPESYKEFAATVKLYLSEKDYEAVLPVLLRVFKDKKHHNLLKSFSNFLIEEHRKSFEASCAILKS